MQAKPYKIPHPFKKLNKSLIDTIVKDIDEGSTFQYAAEANNITEAIFTIWRQQGRIDLEHNLETLPSYLVTSLSKIKQKEIKWCRNKIRNSKKGHNGAQWTLEHAHWRHYGKHAEIKELAQDIEDFKATYMEGNDNGEQVDSESNT